MIRILGIKIRKSKDYKIYYCSLTYQHNITITKQETMNTLIKLLYFFNTELKIEIYKS